jgi:hypothetical protein
VEEETYHLLTDSGGVYRRYHCRLWFGDKGLERRVFNCGCSLVSQERYYGHFIWCCCISGVYCAVAGCSRESCQHI